MNATTSRKATRRAMRRRRLFRSFMSSALALIATTGIALAGTGGTYALWTKAAAPDGVTLQAGTAAMTVTQPAALSLLAPGRTVGQPFTITNSGDVPLNVTVSGATFTGNLASSATVQFTSSPTCAAGATVLWNRTSNNTMTAPTTTVTPLAAGGSVTLCYSVTIATNAAANTEGGVLTPSITLTGTQS